MTMTYRVLLVEDQEGLRNSLERGLRLHQYEVLAVATIAEAQAALQSERIDLLLTDVTLPGTSSGFNLAAWARDRRPGLPILLISGMALFFAPPELRDDPAVRLLAKPFQMATLVSNLTELLAWRDEHNGTVG
jgi:DNA-binding NtrC family response regulator